MFLSSCFDASSLSESLNAYIQYTIATKLEIALIEPCVWGRFGYIRNTGGAPLNLISFMQKLCFFLKAKVDGFYLESLCQTV